MKAKEVFTSAVTVLAISIAAFVTAGLREDLKAATAISPRGAEATAAAISACVEIARKYADVPEAVAWANRRIGFLYKKMGRHSEAADALERSVAADPRQGFAWKDLARAHAAMGNLDKAVAACREGARCCPDGLITEKSELVEKEVLTKGHVECQKWLIELLLKEGRKEEALSEAKRLLAMSSQADWFSVARDKMREVLLAVDGNDKRARQLERFMSYGRAGPDGRPGTPDDIANPLSAIPVAEPERKEGYLASVLTKQPLDMPGHRSRGYAYLIYDDYAEATEELLAAHEAAVKAERKNWIVWPLQDLVHAARLQQGGDPFLENLAESLSWPQNGVQKEQSTATRLLNEGKYEQALAIWKRVIRDCPKNPPFGKANQVMVDAARSILDAWAPHVSDAERLKTWLDLIVPAPDDDPGLISPLVKMAQSVRQNPTVTLSAILTALKNSGEYEDAKLLCLRVIDRHREKEVALRALGMLSPSASLYQDIETRHRGKPVGLEAARQLVVFYSERGEAERAVAAARLLFDNYGRQAAGRKAIEAFARSSQALGKLSEAQGAYGDLFKAALYSPTELADALSAVAEAWASKGDAARAAILLEEVSDLPLEDSSKAVASLKRVAELRNQSGDVKGAVAAARKAALLSMNIPPLALATGKEPGETELKFWNEVLSLSSSREQLSGLLEAFSSEHPGAEETAYAQYILAVLLRREGELDRSLAAARKALDLVPGDPSLAKLLEELTTEQEKEARGRERLAELESHLSGASGQERLDAARKLAAAYVGDGAPGKAVSVLVSAARMEPEAPGAAELYLEAAELATKGGDEGTGRGCYGEAVVLYPDTPQAETAWRALGEPAAEAVPRLAPEEKQLELLAGTLKELETLCASRRYADAAELAMPLYRKLAIRKAGPAIGAFGARLYLVGWAANMACEALQGVGAASPPAARREEAGKVDPFALYGYVSRRVGQSAELGPEFSSDERLLLGFLQSAWTANRDAEIMNRYKDILASQETRGHLEEAGRVVYAYGASAHPGEHIEAILTFLPEGIQPAIFLAAMGDFCAGLCDNRRAAELYELAAAKAATDEQRIQLMAKQAETARTAREFSKAVELCRQIVERYPGCETAARAQETVIAILADDWKSYQSAATECEKLVSLFPGSKAAERAAYLAGEYYYRDKSYDQAISQLQGFLKAHPPSPWAEAAEMVVGLAQTAKGETEAAVETFRRVVERYPTSDSASKAQYLIGYSYLSTQRYDEAAREFQKVAHNYPHSAYAAKAKELLSKLKPTAKGED